MESYVKAFNLIGDFLKHLFIRNRRRREIIDFEIRSLIVDRLIFTSGAHRVLIMEVKNGGGTLMGDNDLYVTMLYSFEDERFLKKLPEFIHYKVDSDFRELVRRVIHNKRVEITFGETKRDTLKYMLMAKYGANLSEYHLLHAEKTRAYFLVTSTAEIEFNPFEKNRIANEIVIDKIRYLLKKNLYVRK